MYDLFLSIDTDATGYVEMQEFFIFLGVNPTQFHKVRGQTTRVHARLLSNYWCDDKHPSAYTNTWTKITMAP